MDLISKRTGCLTSDIREEVVNKKGETSSKALLYTRLPGGVRRESCWREFDTRGSYHPESRTRMELQAIHRNLNTCLF